MPSNIPATTIRIDPEVKKEATAILDEVGLKRQGQASSSFGLGASPPCRIQIRQGGDHCAIARR